MKIELGDGERLDDLLIDGMKIIQNEREFCFSLDAVLLAHFAFVRKHYKILDLGTGTGVMPLLLANKAAMIDALELNPVMADLAARNMRLNQVEDKITVKEGDLRQIRSLYGPQQYDLVICNPPYRPVAHGQINQLDGVARARHEVTANLTDVIAAASFALKFRGRLAMVHLPERLGEIFASMQAHKIVPKRLCFVHPRIAREPTMVLVEGIAGGRPGGLRVEPPVVAHDDAGGYSNAVRKYFYKDGSCHE